MPIDNITRPTISSATNRFNPNQGCLYDKAGNLILDAEGRTFTFNGDNKQTLVKDSQSQTIGSYFYDGDGKRIKKVTQTETTVFVYSGGKLVTEYSSQTPSATSTKYVATDTLGSIRAITDENANIVSRRDFMPFGEELYAGTPNRTTTQKFSTNGDDVRQKFTGYERDKETGLDFAEARYYKNNHGRFTAVDPLLASGKSANPQTFNRYTYVMNNPLAYTDPTGLQVSEEKDDSENILGTVDVFGGPAIYITKTVTYNGKSYSYKDWGNPIFMDIDTSAIDSLLNSQASPSIFDIPIGGKCFGFGACTGPSFSFNNVIGGGKGVYDFGAGAINSSIETPFIVGFPTSLHDFGVPRILDYYEYNNAGERAGGYTTQGALTVGGIFTGGAVATNVTKLSSKLPNLGRGTIFTHFSDADGIAGITGLNPSKLKVGKPVVVNELRFGTGKNPFKANRVGDIFITDYGLDATPGQLSRIGVFKNKGKQQFGIQFSQECCRIENGIAPIKTGQNIFTIPKNTIMKGTFTVTRRY